MSLEEEYQWRAEALLRRATATEDARERSRLIDEALRWHTLAMAAHDGKLAANDDDEGRDGHTRAGEDGRQEEQA